MSPLQCTLCPRLCRLEHGQVGDCRVRYNLDGKMISLVFARPAALHVDPIEKKPLYHFHPASKILSVATVGCNLHCLNCQNWQLSQANPWDSEAMELSPEDLVQLCLDEGSPGLAFTYTDPVVYYEYTLESARAAKDAGLHTVLVSAGYINPEPLAQWLPVIDAANIDLKAFDEDFYQRVCDAHLAPVLDTLVAIKAAGVWLELTNLLIPSLNDSVRAVQQLCAWIVAELGSDTPLHFSAFTPRHKLVNLPRTPASTLLRARDQAREAGLRYVYVGNLLVDEAGTTRCPNDQHVLIERRGYELVRNELEEGRCPQCRQSIAGRWF